MFATTELAIQFACCIAVFLMWAFCILIVRRAARTSAQGFNETNPKAQYSSLPDYAVRAVNAHNNTMEGFLFFFSALVINYIGQGSQFYAALLAIMYTLTRAAFIYCYLKDFGSLRMRFFGGGILLTLGLMVLPFVS